MENKNKSGNTQVSNTQISNVKPGNMQPTYTEIDLVEVFFALKKHVLWIIAACVIGAAAAGIITVFFMTPVYTSTASVLVLSKETTLTSIADIQLGTQLTNDYKVLIRSTSVLENVIDDLKLDLTAAALRRKVNVTNPDGTRLLDISVNDSNPELARDIVNDIASVSSAFIGDKMEVVPPKIIEHGKVPEFKTSPSLKRNLMMGILIGFVISAGIITLFTVMDDTIKSEDDMQKYLGISMLASIPDRRDYINNQGPRKNGNKTKKISQDKKSSQDKKQSTGAA